MSKGFESYLDALLNENDEKKKKRSKVETKAKDDAKKFVETFEHLASTVILPILEKTKKQLDARGRHCCIKEKKVNDIVEKELKGTKFKKEVVNISKDVLEQLYRELWMRRMFWKHAIK